MTEPQTQKIKIKDMTPEQRKEYARKANKKHKIKVQLHKGLSDKEIQRQRYQKPMVEKALYDELFEEYTNLKNSIISLIEKKNFVI